MSDHVYFSQFLHAVWHGESGHPLVASLLAQPAFAVYRNTIFKGCVDALSANYPAVLRLVGEPWFQGAALAYARRHMPDDACLIAYGDGFPDFLDSVDAARELPYLPGVARLDRYWSESHLAADDAPLDVAGLHAALAAGRDVCLAPQAAARWHWESAYPSYSIWDANRRPGVELPSELGWHGEGTLLTRPEGQVQWQRIGHGACRFLDACRAGMGVAEAAGFALEGEPGLDVAAMLGSLVQAGVFTSFH
ncbi:HvfC/BufC N-terminal domain-containing protein [Herbaspirillum chlorophenolicum]|uniref:HvfC/BufC N-terminal domain-containing protein n=1 Tax=Herbaspirillum chlorophenolicum TaxID=211589 RepID=UPI00067BE29B|nr:DNA-binding domain-containing protein [Herbaspirillum chlorophenolicum]